MQNDYGIEVSYAEYMQKVCPVTVTKGRKDDQEITEHERSKARGLIGALQWPATQGMPMLSASMFMQAGELSGANVKWLQDLNKTLRIWKSLCRCQPEVPGEEGQAEACLDDLVLVCYADAAFCVCREHFTLLSPVTQGAAQETRRRSQQTGI